MERQPNAMSSTPPITGATAGARLNSIVTCDISRWAIGPSYVSRMIARPTTMPAPADMPCSARQASRVSIVGASAQPMDAATKTSRFARITGRRPNESDSAPWNSVMIAKLPMYADSVCCTSSSFTA